VIGLVGCVVLAFTVPVESLVPGVLILLAGVAGRAFVLRRRAGAAA
jgi:APA family basic amino acid/polyamine antiporter